MTRKDYLDISSSHEEKRKTWCSVSTHFPTVTHTEATPGHKLFSPTRVWADLRLTPSNQSGHEAMLHGVHAAGYSVLD